MYNFHTNYVDNNSYMNEVHIYLSLSRHVVYFNLCFYFSAKILH